MRRRRSAGPPQPCRALVSGGSGGIGAAVCKALATVGMHVIVHAGSRLDRAEQVVAEIIAAGGQAEAVQFDLGDEAACSAAMTRLTEPEPLAVVVHNAGTHDDAPLAGMTALQWQRVIDINLNAFYRLVQPAMLGMARLRWGRVVAISSVAARLGNRGQANYAAAKAGLHGAVICLTREMAARGITANTVAPGLVDTDMLDSADSEQALALVPAGRLGRPEEIAALVAFLCSDQAAYINGQLIGIDGGMAPG
ncbi:MAG: 3-oxoacyl-ACP reductase FabG [Wenzhouxiangella sp.]|nr:3-oxoacyl-ACP reductase FabG [Wenzhouxiangella sp.]MCH8477044.1 3-oxoacyl-ACP reductase FabG [Wenzhouxiangella sp.]TVR96478.1 MAG: 3-oxoacyl-ACP reductase FabG [Wenzhouxiangellaceae bacterium]